MTVDPPLPAAAPASKPSVGFASTNTVIDPGSDNDKTQSVRKQLAPVFSKTCKRKTTLFLRIRLPVDKKPRDPTNAARLKLKELGELMIEQDPSTLIYRYKQSSEDEIDACTQLSQLPTTITGLQAFMNGFRPSTEGGDIWGSLRIGIDTPAADFLDNVAQEAFMRKFWVRAAPLQVADSDNAGWLYLSTEHLDPITTADSINTFIARYCARKGRTPFTVACERRMIWDDKAGANSKLSVKERNAKKAMHIVCEKGRQQDTAAFVRGWLKSKVGRAFTNLPMKFIPNFSKGQGVAYNSKFSHAVQKHMKLTAFGTRHSLTYEFSDLDTRCDMLEGSPSLRELILSMRTRLKPAPANESTPPTPTPVFLSIDPNTRHSERGSFVATYTVDNAEEAEEKLRNLLSYLSHEYGDSASYWFSATAIERADNMAWDDEQQRPITTEELDLDALLDDDLDWIANVEEAQKTFQPTVEVTLERPSILRKVSNNPMAGEADSVKTFNVTQLPAGNDGENSDSRDAESGDSAVAGDPEGSSADAA
jgi:hypothetical protein